MGDHDENIDFERAADIVGHDLAVKVRDIAIRLYSEAAAFALGRGIVIADTKFEFGLDDAGTLTLMDEVLTPDSSRFWPAASVVVGRRRRASTSSRCATGSSRSRSTASRGARSRLPPALPDEVVAATAERYRRALAMLA
jgi:phosphoribosylaminoimidazole-succinocarboxamide synthase